MLLCMNPKRLAELGSVDANQTYLVLKPVSVDDANGIAVMDGDNVPR